MDSVETYTCERCTSETDESMLCEECGWDGLCADCFHEHDCKEGA